MDSIRLLLVEADLADAALLRTALEEIEECRYWRNWRRAETIQVDTLADALDLLRTEPFDAILLDLDLPDSKRSQTFLPVCALAPDVPVILLTNRGDEALAARLVREGAQDFLLKEQIDSHPLARAIENAMERNRILCAARSALLTDCWTGLPNEAGFHAFANQMRGLALRFGLSLMVAVAEPEEACEDRWHSDPDQAESALLDAAVRLRVLLSDADLLGRLSAQRLAIAVTGRNRGELEAVYSRLELSNAANGIRLGAAFLDAGGPLDGSGPPLALEDLLEAAQRALADRVSTSVPK
jgi:PleD family two-component response regulator